MSKSLTKDCPTCDFLIKGIDEKSQFCGWGRSKKKKKLVANRRAILVREQCKLLIAKVLRKKISKNVKAISNDKTVKFGSKKLTKEEKSIVEEVNVSG